MVEPDDPENKIGVYLLHNPETDQAYVGSSQDIEERRKIHLGFLKRGNHPNGRLQAAYNVNPNFEFVGLVLGDREASFDYEQSVIDDLRGYKGLLNISRDARYCSVPFTDETKRKISESNMGKKHTDQAKAKIGAASRGNTYALGVKHSPEFGAKVSERLMGHATSAETRAKIGKANTGKVHTEETKLAISLKKTGVKQDPEVVERRAVSLRGQTRTPEQIQMYREAKVSVAKKISIDGVVYGSLNEAGRVLGLNPGTVYARLNSDNFATWFYETA